MGFRINTNIASLVALRNLKLTESSLQKTLERLSTGQRVNRPQDDPAGLSLSESLRSQVRALKQTTNNARLARDMLNTADSALGEVGDILIELRRSITFALNGGATRETIAAEQQSVDAALEALRRIGRTARFGSVPLLDGSGGFLVSGVSPSGILEVNVFSARLNPVVDPTPFQIDVTQTATQASGIAGSSAAGTSIAASGGGVELRIAGSIGTVDISLASGATSAQFQEAINSSRGFTGIYASGGYLFSEGFGTEATLRIEQIGGTGVFRGGDPLVPGLSGTGGAFFDAGQNAVVTMNSHTVSGAGNTVTLNTAFFSGQVELNPISNQDPARGPGSTGTFSFFVRRTGLTFQFGTDTGQVNQPTLGIPSMLPEDIGSVPVVIGGILRGGQLSSLSTGEGNDLENNPENALGIVLDALADVGRVRASLGAFVAHVVEPTERTQAVTIENLRAADSDLRDADFAVEAADLARRQVLFQAGISVLAQANTIPAGILELLR